MADSLPFNQALMNRLCGEGDVMDTSCHCVDSDESCDGGDYQYCSEDHSSIILKGLDSLRGEGRFCDVTICVEDQEFPCHRAVLASYSAYFRAMFSSELLESKLNKVTLNGVEAHMINSLIDYAYTGEIMLTKTNVQSLLGAASLLQVLPVQDACCRFMARNMDESNCLGIWCFAEQMSCTALQKKAKNFTLLHFKDVVKLEEFGCLQHAKLVELVSSDELEVDNEEIVFDALKRWYESDKDCHKEHFELVFEHVRLPLISPYYIFDCIEKYPAVANSNKCRQLVEEAKLYHLLPDRRSEHSSARTRPRKSSDTVERIVAVGGEDDKVVLRSVESYNPLAKEWKTLACLPFAVSKHGLVVSGNNTSMLYLAGGEYPDGAASKTFWRYDPTMDTWQQLESMNVPRSELGLAMLDGHVYAVGGWEGCSRLDSVEFYDPATKVWKFVDNMKMAVTSPAVAVIEGQLYVTGGAVLEDGDGIDLVQCYNPKNNTWTQLPSMLIARSGSAACVLNGFIYVIGGWHASTENTNKVERYNPSKQEWESRCPMNERRYRPGVSVVDGKIYVLGGEEGWDRYHDTIECYDEAKDAWSIIGEMVSSRSWLSCVCMRVKQKKEQSGRSSPAMV